MMVGGDIGEVKAGIGPRHCRAAARSCRALSLEPDDPHGVRLDRGLARSQGRRDPRHRRRRRQRPGRVVRRALRRAARAEVRRRDHRRAAAPATSRSPSGGGSAPRSCRRSGSATAPRRACGCRRTRCSPATPRAAWCSHGFIDQAATLAVVDRTTNDLRRAQGQARSRGREPLRRQPAEIHRRPRNPARARRAGRQPADLGRRCRAPRPPSARR